MTSDEVSVQSEHVCDFQPIGGLPYRLCYCGRADGPMPGGSSADQYVTRADAARPVPAEPCFLIFFEDQDRPPEVFMLGENDEAAARHRFENVLSGGWNAHLFQRIDDGKRPARSPTGAAPMTTSPALLTKERLEPLLSKLRTSNSVSVLVPTHIFTPVEAAALLQHIAALTTGLSEQETLLAERNRQNAAAFAERDELQRDAARYRYLRNQEGLPTPEEFDRMVDADMAMAAEGRTLGEDV